MQELASADPHRIDDYVLEDRLRVVQAVLETRTGR